VFILFSKKKHQQRNKKRMSIKKIIGLREEMSIGFYLCDFLFRKVLRHNADVSWAIHFTSVIHGAARIKRGKGVYPGDSPNVFINADNGIEIGDYTNIGPGVALVSANHDFINNEINVAAAPIKIGKHSWLGHSASVMPGIVLGDFTIVGAGAVVTKSFEEGYCVIAGNPAKIIRQLDKTACIAYANSK